MASCEVCGNDYENTFRVIQGTREMTFDCFEWFDSRLRHPRTDRRIEWRNWIGRLPL